MEHLHHFDLSQDPFQNEPDLRFYVDCALHRDCQRRMERGIRQAKGLCILTGEGGTGKTLLARRILDSLEEEMFDPNLMVILPGAADAESVLLRFARQVGVEDPSDDRSALLAQLYEQLAIVREDGRHCVLILDDAHILGRDAMAEVCGLLTFEYEDRRLLSLLLVGPPQLDVTLSQDTSLAARVDVRVHLAPLDLDNSRAYLAHRLSVVGGSPETFSEAAIASLYKLGRGRPRLLNTLADNGLFEAYLDGQKQVDAPHVERAAADLGVGGDPGRTYSERPTPREPRAVPSPAPAALERPAPAPARAPVSVAEATVVALDDPNEDSALELSTMAPMSDEPRGDVDLGTLLQDSDVDVDGDDADLTVISMLDDSDAGTRDLDAMLPEPSDDLDMDLPSFRADNSSAPATADPTRLAFEDDVLEVDADDEVDDLFIQLIEE